MNMDRFIALITTFVDLFISFKLVNAHQCGITPKDKIYRWKIPLTEPKIKVHVPGAHVSESDCEKA